MNAYSAMIRNLGWGACIVTPASAVACLNELLELDRPAVAALMANRVPCNAELADHPTCQVGTQHGGWHVGALGLINALFGTIQGGPRDGWGWITMVFEDDPAANGQRLARFVVTDPEAALEGHGEPIATLAEQAGE